MGSDATMRNGGKLKRRKKERERERERKRVQITWMRSFAWKMKEAGGNETGRDEPGSGVLVGWQWSIKVVLLQKQVQRRRRLRLGWRSTGSRWRVWDKEQRTSYRIGGDVDEWTVKAGYVKGSAGKMQRRNRLRMKRVGPRFTVQMQ